MSSTVTRRELFTMFTKGSSFRTQSGGAERQEIMGGADTYTTPLSEAAAYHLLRRISFAPTPALVAQIVGKTATQAVEMLLGSGVNEQDPPLPGTWIDTWTENPENADIDTRNAIENQWKSNFVKLQDWWIEQMRSESSLLREKLTLFWSGHFTTEFTYDLGYIPPQMLYRQNVLLRKDRLVTDFRKMLEDVTLDAAMLEYLGGILNVKGRANENYAREMMELYSTGVGYYTEGDVQEAARVLTGWQIGKYKDEIALNGAFNSFFSPQRHDTTAKQFMGQSIPARNNDENTEYGVRTEEIRGMIKILFEQRGDVIATFMAKKFYRYFVYSNPSATDMQVVAAFAKKFQDSNFNIRVLVQSVLTSEHFYDEANIGVQIKTPAEFVVGLGRQLGVALSGAGSVMTGMEQTLIDPPNVAGWEGYRVWINTKTFPNRTSYAKTVVKALSDAQALNFVKTIQGYENVDTFLQEAIKLFFPKAISDSRKASYRALLLQGAPDYEWATITKDAAATGTRLRAFLNTIVKAPDFHLC